MVAFPVLALPATPVVLVAAALLTAAVHSFGFQVCEQCLITSLGLLAGNCYSIPR